MIHFMGVNMKIKTMTNWVERKDLSYWVFIITLIWLLSSDFGKNNQPLLDNWNFAATIVSIILAVLAIVYTYAQSTMTLQSTQKLDESAVKIEEVSNTLKTISVDKLFDNLEAKINSLESSLDIKVSKQFESHYKKVFGPLREKEMKSPLAMEELLTKDQWEIFLNNYVKGDGNVLGLVLVFAYFKKAKDIEAPFNEFAKWFADTYGEKEDSEFFIGTFNGVLTTLESFNIITVESYEKGSKVMHMSHNFEEAIKRIVESGEFISVVKFVKDFIDLK